MATKKQEASRQALRQSADQLAAQAEDMNKPNDAAPDEPVLDAEIAFEELPITFDAPPSHETPLFTADAPVPVVEAVVAETVAVDATTVGEGAADAVVVDAVVFDAVIPDDGVVDGTLVEAAPMVASANTLPAPITAAPPRAPQAVPHAALLSKRAKMMAIAAGCALMIGAMALARDASNRGSVDVGAAPAARTVEAPTATPTAAPAPPVEPETAVETAPAPVAAAVPPAASPSVNPAQKAPVTSRQRLAATGAAAPTVATPVTAPAPLPLLESAAKPVHREAITPAAMIATTIAEAPMPVTITGCLEGTNDGVQFRLTDTDDAAPRARGWKSGFLKKKPAPVSLTAGDTSALRKYIGHRVSATGVLASREMQVRSFVPTGAMCE